MIAPSVAKLNFFCCEAKVSLEKWKNCLKKYMYQRMPSQLQFDSNICPIVENLIKHSDNYFISACWIWTGYGQLISNVRSWNNIVNNLLIHATV